MTEEIDQLKADCVAWAANYEELGKTLAAEKQIRRATEAENDRLKTALAMFSGFWRDDQLKGLPDAHLFELVWARDEDRIDEETGKRYPAITAGQLRRAAITYAGKI